MGRSKQDTLRQRLLPTAPEEVPTAMAEAIAGACAEHGEVRAAYVGRLQRRTPGGHGAIVESLSLAIEPLEPLTEDDPRHASFDALLLRLPPGILRSGVAFLAPAGVQTWRDLAITVYARRDT